VDSEGVRDGHGHLERSEVSDELAGLPGDGLNGDFQAGFVRAAHAIITGKGDAPLLSQLTDLCACAEYEYDLDVQGLKYGDVLEQIGENGLTHQSAIQCNNEDALPELRHVAQDAAQVFEALLGFVGVTWLHP
jgi:hypothetical protein